MASGILQPGTQELEHFQTADLYGRRCKVTAGHMFTTPVHKFDHIAVCLAGRIVIVDHTGTRTEVVAPYVAITRAGTQRAVYVLEDVDWLTVHHTEHQDLDTMMDALSYPSMAEYIQLLSNEVPPCL